MSEQEKTRKMLVSLIHECELLGKDLQEIEDGTRSYPTALLNEDLIKEAKSLAGVK